MPRGAAPADGTANAPSGALRVGDLELEESTRRVTRAGRPVALSPTEYELLLYLMRNAGIVVAKSDLLRHVWSYDFGGNTAIVESYICYLRRKLDGAGPALIHTRRGGGYVLRAPG